MADKIIFVDRHGRAVPASAIFKQSEFNTKIFAPAGGIHAQAVNKINLNAINSKN